MAIQVRRGNEADFDPSKMLPGEWAVSLDTKYVRMCFSPGVCVRMATYEAFEADMEQIKALLEEAESIEEAVAKIQTEINDAAVVVEDYSILSKSYAVGGTGKRENENSDNAKYYYQQTKQISQSINGIVPMGTVTFENLPTENIVKNAMYNISDSFVSDERFNDGGGVSYGAGNNVIWTAEEKWDVTASSAVTGIKGDNETAYRQGNVSLSANDIGALPSNGNAVSATKAEQDSDGNEIVSTYAKKSELSDLENKVNSKYVELSTVKNLLNGVVLWENNNLSSAKGAFTVTLATLSTYSKIEILHYEILGSVRNLRSTGKLPILSGWNMSLEGLNSYRDYMITGTRIDFEGGYVGIDDSMENDSFCIPYQIIGYE